MHTGTITSWTWGAVLGGLMAFGLAYNGLVGWLERHGYDHGYTALLVVGGVGVTVLASAILIGWSDALRVLACFAASGTPMVIGSVWRYATERTEEEKALLNAAREELHGGDAA